MSMKAYFVFIVTCTNMLVDYIRAPVSYITESIVSENL